MTYPFKEGRLTRVNSALNKNNNNNNDTYRIKKWPIVVSHRVMLRAPCCYDLYSIQTF